MQKKPVFIFILAFYVSLVFGQGGYKKQVFFEHFTNSICSSCKTYNPTILNLVSQFKQDIVHVTYHPSIPYAACEFFKSNPTENDSRAFYYQVAGTPTVVINGKEQRTGSSFLTSNELAAYIQQTTPLQLIANQTGSANRSIQIQYKLSSKPAKSTYRLHVMAIEKVVDKTTPNGEPQHFNVFRKAITPIKGMDVSADLEANLTGNYTFNYSIPSSYSASQISFIAFIQNDATKEVLNVTETNLITALNELESSEIEIFPNPVFNTFHVKSDDFPISLKISDSKGILLYFNEKYTGEKIDVADYQKGIWIVEVRDSFNRKCVKKILKN